MIVTHCTLRSVGLGTIQVPLRGTDKVSDRKHPKGRSRRQRDGRVSGA
jgi:hypothetical protein